MVQAIFESFKQADSSITRKYQGAGLGLAIVKRLVRLMQGSISLDTKLGVGSTFYVSIPIKSAQECNAKDALMNDKHFQEKRRKVLVVEDDLINRMYLMRFLEKKEYYATSAENGEKALQALRQEDFDCVLMDVQMPIMDGLETTTMIRNSPDFKHCMNIPIIALTAHALKGDREKFLATGMSGYIAKPVDFQELMDVMDGLCAVSDHNSAMGNTQ
jgi:CheY-like chemotaxis protein